MAEHCNKKMTEFSVAKNGGQDHKMLEFTVAKSQNDRAL
jgi:hypothetical protein